jgi:hypothetical protein
MLSLILVLSLVFSWAQVDYLSKVLMTMCFIFIIFVLEVMATTSKGEVWIVWKLI